VDALFSLSNLPNRLRPYDLPPLSCVTSDRNFRYISTYLSSFFSLPVRTLSGERLTHEQVVNKLDDETVAYEAELGINSAFEEIMRVSIRVEIAQYETALAWLRDLLYGSEFDKERQVSYNLKSYERRSLPSTQRLQITLAKTQQSLPELKRDARAVLSSTMSDLLYDETSTPRALGVLSQAEVIPTLLQELQDEPERVVASFEELRKAGRFGFTRCLYCVLICPIVVQPSGIRFSVTGNVLGIPKPRSAWSKYFANLVISISRNV
jgi:Zn-dependent M16 (insulinase) family peptidase